MPIPLGILAVAGAGAGAAGSFDLLETTILSSNTASITFSNLGNYSSTYKHLQIRGVFRTTVSAAGAQGSIRFNGDTGSNYAYHYLQGTGSAVQSAGFSSQTSIENAYVMSGDTDVANGFAAAVIDILDPFSTSKNTTIRALSGAAGNEDRIRLGSGFWNNTASITSIEIYSANSLNLKPNTRVSLYGIRG